MSYLYQPPWCLNSRDKFIVRIGGKAYPNFGRKILLGDQKHSRPTAVFLGWVSFPQNLGVKDASIRVVMEVTLAKRLCFLMVSNLCLKLQHGSQNADGWTDITLNTKHCKFQHVAVVSVNHVKT
jgi:hypothetical protein